MNLIKSSKNVSLVAIIVALPVLVALRSDSGQVADWLNAATPTEKIASISWLQGHWTRTDGKDHLEEIWSNPAGDSIVGMFRWLKNGRVWLFELMAITVEDDTLVFRLRHFDRKQVPWEGKHEPLTYPLKHLSHREAIFENPERDHPRRFIFRRTDDTTYVVRMEGYENGKPSGADEFVFHRN